MANATEIIPFRTPPLRVAQCGETTPPPPVDRSKPLLFATTGMVINARGIEMTLVDVQRVEQDGFYKGVAKVAPKYLGGASFFVKFDKVFIDETRTVVGPERIDFITQGVANMMQEQLAAQQERRDERQQQANREAWADTEFHEQIFQYDNIAIDTITFDSDGNPIIASGSNIQANYEVGELLNAPVPPNTEPKAIIIEDKNGDQWVVQKKDGGYKATKVPGGGLSPTMDVDVASQDLGIVRKALRQLRSEYSALINSYSLPAQAVDYSVAVAIEYFSEETANRQGYTLIAQNLKIGEKAVTDYLREARTQNLSEDEKVNAVKQAIVELVGATMRSLMGDIDSWVAQITQDIGPNYRSALGAGPLADDPSLLPECFPTAKEDRAIIKDYFSLMKQKATEIKDFFSSFFAANGSTALTGRGGTSDLCRHSVEKAGNYFLRFKLQELSFLADCMERGYQKGKVEFFNPGIQGAFFIAYLEGLLCLTEKERCANYNGSIRFSYGLANGLLQQLNVPEMRDALFELLKSTTENKLECLMNAREVSQKLATARDAKEVIKILSRCIYGVEIDVDQASLMFNNAWTWIQANYTDSYVQGQATAFILTIVLPPVIKALQSVKLINLLKNARGALLRKLVTIPELPPVETFIDDIERGVADDVAKGAGSAFKVITTDIGTALRNRVSHIRKIVFEAKSNGTYRFSGCHSKSAIDELGTNARIEITIPKNAEGVYEAKVFAKGPDGKEIIKSGNGGKSTFFPDHWDEAKILEEAEFAVKNNKGLIDPTDATKGYYGFSKDGKVKIGFYYRDADGYIGSFFPILNP